MSINIVNQRYDRLINVIIALVLVLGITVSGVVYYKGDDIANRTLKLIEQEVPAYDLLRKLNNGLIEQERLLYEFYANQQQNSFERGFTQNNLQSQITLDALYVQFGDILPLQITQTNLQELNILADDFVQNINASETNWILARRTSPIIRNC